MEMQATRRQSPILRPKSCIHFEYEVEHLDRDGRLVRRQRRPAESFVRGFGRLVHATLVPANLSALDSGGLSRNLGIQSSLTFLVASSNIGIGTGTEPVTIAMSDFAMTQAFATGAASISTTPLVDSGTEYRFRATRLFTVASPVTITEIGLFYTRKDTAGTLRSFMAAHDALSPSVALLADENIRVNYEISITT